MAFTVEIDADTPRPQGEETFVLVRDGQRTEMRIHDYDAVYAVPGLYEHVVQERLRCTSPQTLAARLAAAVRDAGQDPGTVRVWDVGAGNGVSGEALAAEGLVPAVGLDVSPTAREAVARDRPGLYGEWILGGLEDVDATELVDRLGLNALAGAGALTGGHIEPAVLAATWDAFAPGAWIAFTCPQAHADGARDVLAADYVVDEPFPHRLLTDGTPVTYRVLVGRRAPGM